MMRIHFIMSLFCISIISCKGIKNSSHQESNNSGSKDSLGKIEKLPFGPAISNGDDLCNKSYGFYLDLLGKEVLSDNPQYLPIYALSEKVKSIKYVPIDSVLESVICNEFISADSIEPSLFRYRYKLPDCGQFSIYYMTNSVNNIRDFSSEFYTKCQSFIFGYYGYLILYNNVTSEMSIVTIYYDGYSDGSHKERSFYIDKKHKIFICNKTYSEGSGSVDAPIESKFELTIKDDNIKIVKTH